MSVIMAKLLIMAGTASVFAGLPMLERRVPVLGGLAMVVLGAFLLRL